MAPLPSSPVHEPWAPAVGDLVRVNVSPECRAYHLGPRGMGFAGMLLPQEQRRLHANGQIGRVTSVHAPFGDEPPADAAHRFYVHDLPPHDGPRWDDFFAAVELEPVEDAS